MGFLKYLVVPAAMGGSYMLVRKNQKLTGIQKAGIVAGTGLLTFLVQRTVTSFGGNVQKAPVDYGQIPYVYDSAGQPVRWDPDPLSKEIFEHFEDWNAWTYPETTDKITELQPEQLKLLYNHYNQYYAKEFPTLTKLIDAEWGQTPTAYRSYKRAVARLRQFGLNEYY
jgi:hypothetical protein